MRNPGNGNENESQAAYMPGGLAFPLQYTIDAEVCIKMECAICLEVCAYDAIQLDAQPAEKEIQAGKTVVATGWQLYDPSKIGNYHYEHEPDVITNLEFEHLLASCTRENKKLTRPSDGKVPGRIAFIQCAGSRDHNHLSYCSSVCCSATIKQTLTLAEQYPEMQSEVFYIDLRLSGRNEKLLTKAKNNDQITLTRGKAGRISKSDSSDGLVIEVEDMMAGRRREDSFDMVVLAMGMEPNHMGMEPKNMVVELELNEQGFYLDSQAPGIYPAATCKRPMDVVSSVRDATAAALKTLHM